MAKMIRELPLLGAASLIPLIKAMGTKKLLKISANWRGLVDKNLTTVEGSSAIIGASSFM